MTETPKTVPAITEAQFSRQVAYMAKACAEWAGDMLTMDHRLQDPMDPIIVRRFTDEMRKRCDRLDQWADGASP